ncbi:zf-HC2 domain-containing protein [Streptomyces chromofuscus]|uniref:Zf-HC2 domain-containing protein n=1 Tax=Streptomyces chromofuscus TaxID=42881 RepID=A0A7M2T4H1_STRCW|nr:zf-HC2 domain-containing protein [Streptomyces chromofuscus]QOV42783.1 zf-HC2 domain-containing protein [Streptomyces chromofuscus]GGS90802.1 membrane protein [Streptomyces chromofuscus]
MSGTRPTAAEEHLAEQHLGDRLAALVDGELGHDTRERVLAHVATCPKCKAEVDAQRRLKNVFAEAAPPPPSESFLARLQGLPGGGDVDGGVPPMGGGFGGGLPTARPGAPGVFGVRRGERFDFAYVPAAAHASVLPGSVQRGFRMHDVGRSEAERAAASRGRRFAFVAAGAVSLAAIALGGVTVGTPADTDTRGGSGSNVTPARPGSGTATAPENQRRRGVGPLLAQGQGGRTLGDMPVAPTEVSAPLLPGVAAQPVHALTAPVVAGAAAMSPLIRPPAATPPITLTSWSTAPEVTVPGLLAAPVTDGSPAPSASSARAPR